MPKGVAKNPTPKQKANQEKRMVTRPPSIIDWNLVDQWLEDGNSGPKIAEAIGIDVSTLYKRCVDDRDMSFSELKQQKCAKGEFDLLRTQHLLAHERNAMMLIWLGKNRLNQRDTPKEVEFTGEALESFKSIADQLKSLQGNTKPKQEEEQSTQCSPPDGDSNFDAV